MCGGGGGVVFNTCNELSCVKRCDPCYKPYIVGAMHVATR